MSQFNVFQDQTKRESGKKAQHGNISAAKVIASSPCPSPCARGRVLPVVTRQRALREICVASNILQLRCARMAETMPGICSDLC